MHGSFASLYGYSTEKPIAKVASADQRRIERLVTRMEGEVKRSFLQFVRTVQSPDVLREVAELVARGDIETALQIVDRHLERMGPVLTNVFIEAGHSEGLALAEQVRSWASYGFAFDPVNQRAAELMRDAQLRFIREISESQRESIRQAITESLESLSGPRAMGRAIRNAIGLTAKQEAAVRNYRRLLEQGSREALDRELRDRRFDRTVARADRTGEPLTAKQIDRMVDRYRQRYIAYRADTIAITETGAMVSAARQEAFDQATVTLGIRDDQIERSWRTIFDGHERSSHRYMQVRTVRGREAPFVTGNGVKMMRPHAPGAPSYEVVRCRCHQRLRIKKP